VAETAERRALHEERDRLRAEIDGYDRLIWRQGELLTGAINALRGDPPELTTWSHHDIAEVAAEVVAERDAAIKRAEAAEREARQAANRAALSHKAALMAQADTKAAELRADMAGIHWLHRYDAFANAAALYRTPAP